MNQLNPQQLHAANQAEQNNPQSRIVVVPSPFIHAIPSPFDSPLSFSLARTHLPCTAPGANSPLASIANSPFATITNSPLAASFGSFSPATYPSAAATAAALAEPHLNAITNFLSPAVDPSSLLAINNFTATSLQPNSNSLQSPIPPLSSQLMPALASAPLNNPDWILPKNASGNTNIDADALASLVAKNKSFDELLAEHGLLDPIEEEASPFPESSKNAYEPSITGQSISSSSSSETIVASSATSQPGSEEQLAQNVNIPSFVYTLAHDDSPCADDNDSRAFNHSNSSQSSPNLPDGVHTTVPSGKFWKVVRTPIQTFYQCPYPNCLKTFTRPYNLKSHYRAHTGERPFICTTCQQAFARKHDLKRHQKLHEGQKPFLCPACNKPFARNDALKRHLKPVDGSRESACALRLRIIANIVRRGKQADINDIGSLSISSESGIDLSDPQNMELMTKIIRGELDEYLTDASVDMLNVPVM